LGSLATVWLENKSTYLWVISISFLRPRFTHTRFDVFRLFLRGLLFFGHREKVCSYLLFKDRDVDRLSIKLLAKASGQRSVDIDPRVGKKPAVPSVWPWNALRVRRTRRYCGTYTPPSREPPLSRWRNTRPHRHAADRVRSYRRQLRAPTDQSSGSFLRFIRFQDIRTETSIYEKISQFHR